MDRQSHAKKKGKSLPIKRTYTQLTLFQAMATDNASNAKQNDARKRPRLNEDLNSPEQLDNVMLPSTEEDYMNLSDDELSIPSNLS